MKHTYMEQKVGHLFIYTDGTLMEVNVDSHNNRSVSYSTKLALN